MQDGQQMVQVRPGAAVARRWVCWVADCLSPPMLAGEGQGRSSRSAAGQGNSGPAVDAGACRVGTANAPPATCIRADQRQGPGGDTRRLNDMDFGWAWLGLAGLTAPVAGVKKHADNNSG